MLRRLACGLAAGATGTIALELTSYVDMLVRGRVPSDQPQRLGSRPTLWFERWNRRRRKEPAEWPRIGFRLRRWPGPADAICNGGPDRDRPVLVAALVLAAGAMIGSNALPIALGLTDPRSWTVDDWLTDAGPHLAYGLVAALTYEALVGSERQ